MPLAIGQILIDVRTEGQHVFRFRSTTDYIHILSLRLAIYSIRTDIQVLNDLMWNATYHHMLVLKD